MQTCNYCKEKRELKFLGLNSYDLRFYCNDRELCRDGKELFPANSKDGIIKALGRQDMPVSMRLFNKPIVSRLSVEDAIYFIRFATSRDTSGISDTISSMIAELRQRESLEEIPLTDPLWDTNHRRTKQPEAKGGIFLAKRSDAPEPPPKPKPKLKEPEPEPEPEDDEDDTLEL